MSILLRIQDGQDYHTFVVDEIQRWKVDYYSRARTTIYMRDGSSITLDNNHERVLEEAKQAREVAKL